MTKDGRREGGLIGRTLKRLGLGGGEVDPLAEARREIEAGHPAEAARRLFPLAQAGDAAAQYELGHLYETGRGVVRNLADAATWYELAAAQDHADAIARLATLLTIGDGGAGGGDAFLTSLFPNGVGIGREPEKARELAMRAAGKGHLPAQALAGYLHAAGIGGPVDMAAALAFYEPAAKAGNAEAALGLGTLLAGGHLGAADFTAARPWFEAAAAAGNATAMTSLAIDLLDGRGGPADRPRAVELLGRAAQTGHGAALRLLGVLHGRGEVVERDPARAETLLRAAVSRGDTEAAFRLGEMQAGQDPSSAREWWRRAAEHGHCGAMRALADCLKAGRGGPRDPVAAAQWLEAAARAGDRDAQFGLGVAYAVGDGVGADLGRAAEWSRRAAEAGHSAAKVNIGRFFMQGAGVERDPASALRWLRSAIDDGEIAAIVALGELFGFWADPPDRVRARALFEHAVRLGDARAGDLLARLDAEDGATRRTAGKPKSRGGARRDR
jgi:TPR repeat protein